MHAKELGWNDRCSALDGIPAYDATKDKYCDIFFRKQSAAVSAPKVQSKRVTKDDIRQAYHAAAQDSSRAPLFASVAAAFDFEHHVGSDPPLELQVLRAILLRESLLTQIETLAHDLTKPHVFAGDEPNYERMNAQMLDLLGQCRHHTLEVVEVTERWRGDRSEGPTVPFMWQNTNYLLKMCRDLDYLSEVSPLLQMLNVRPESIRHNPLMLENTLDQTAFESEASAGSAEGLSAEEKVEYSRKLLERVRMRRAEAVLSREENLFGSGCKRQRGEVLGAVQGGVAPAGAPPATNTALVPAAIDVAKTEATEVRPDDEGPPSGGALMATRSLMAGSGTEWGERQKELLTWYDEAEAQLARLREPYYVRGGSKSTGRLSVPKREKLQPMQYMPSFAQNLDRAPTLTERKLTELLSMTPSRLVGPTGGKKLRAITAPYSPSLVPQPEGMEDQHAIADDSTRNAKLRAKREVKSRYMEPRKVWSEEDVARQQRQAARLPASPESIKFGVPARPMTPSVRQVVTLDELTRLQELETPSEDVTIVAASTLILLSEGVTLPSDVRWCAFQQQDGAGLIRRIEVLEPEDVPDFKLRALRRFLSIDAYNPVSLAETSNAAANLAVWILRVIAAHPAGGAYIKEVRSALVDWDFLQSKSRKKEKKRRSKKGGAIPPDGGGRHSEDLAHKLIGDMKRAAFAIEKSMIQELRSAVRGKLVPSCVRALEAVALVLSPKKKPSVEVIRNLMSKGTAFEALLRGFDRRQAEALSDGALERLSTYTKDPALECGVLGRSSKVVAMLMHLVQAVGAYAEHNQKVVAAEQAELNRAATKLQGMQRSKVAKKAVLEKREQHQAASTLQRRTRVHHAKRAVAAKRQEKGQASSDGKPSEDHVVVEKERDKETAAAALDARDRPDAVADDTDIAVAATKLQGAARQKKARDRVESIRKERAPSCAPIVTAESDTEAPAVATPVRADAASKGGGSPTPLDTPTPQKSATCNGYDTYQSEDFEDFEDDDERG